MDPFPKTWTVRRARDAYLAENGFTVEAYDAKWNDASVFGVPVKVPNTSSRRRAIKIHDLLHVATGYGTDLAGEAEISAWELRRGLRDVGWYVRAIITTSAVLGLLFARQRTLAAWRASTRRTSYFADTLDYAAVLDGSVGQLRAALGLPEDGIATAPRGLHTYAPRVNPLSS